VGGVNQKIKMPSRVHKNSKATERKKSKRSKEGRRETKEERKDKRNIGGAAMEAGFQFTNGQYA